MCILLSLENQLRKEGKLPQFKETRAKDLDSRELVRIFVAKDKEMAIFKVYNDGKEDTIIQKSSQFTFNSEDKSVVQIRY